MSVRVSDALSPQGGAVGPFEYDGTLFIVAASFLASVESEHTTLAIYKSTDDGATWAQVGTELTLPSADDSGSWNSPVNDFDNISACVDTSDPTLVYVLHVNGDFDLQVDVLDMAAEDWGDTSAPGPNIFPSSSPTNLSGSTRLGWLIEQSTTGTFGILSVMWEYDTVNAIDVETMFALSLSSDLGTWSSRNALTMPAGSGWDVAGIARGTSGRVHGWVSRANEEMYHVLVVGSGGGLGTELASVTDGDWVFQSSTAGASDEDGNIGFLFAKEVSGIGTPYRLGMAFAASADSPSFTVSEVDTTTQSSNSYSASLVSGATLWAAWNRGAPDDAIRETEYSGSWGSTVEAENSLAPYDICAKLIAAGVGVVFSQDVSEVYYLAPTGPSGQTITGTTTFGGFVFLSPGYVFLGGGCGTLPTGPGCSGGDPMTDDCSLQGFSI